jgi:alcohol dehydrogenase
MKMVIMSPKITPFISVNDPMLMQTMPKEVTASSGIDVISHAIEALSATEASPVTDALALEAIRLTAAYLPRAYENGNDLEAREKMMYASAMAGMAFTNGGLGYIHALAHQLGGFYEQNAHGCYNAVLLPHVLEFNAAAMPAERLEKIAGALGVESQGRPQAVDGAAEAIRKLSAGLGIAGDLRSMGVLEEDIPAMASNALKDVCALTNPRQGTAEEIAGIFRAAY